MADIAASVLAQLKNKSKESGRSYQLFMTSTILQTNLTLTVSY